MREYWDLDKVLAYHLVLGTSKDEQHRLPVSQMYRWAGLEDFQEEQLKVSEESYPVAQGRVLRVSGELEKRKPGKL